MQTGNVSRPPLASASRPRLILEGHRALLRSLREDSFMLDTCPGEVLNWLEENLLIEEVLDDENEFHFHITEQGRRAVLGRAAGEALSH